MSDEIDISKLHGSIKEIALACERDKKNSKGYGKLNTQYELNLFKEMVTRAGKQEELKRQLPNIKGVTIPDESLSKKEKEVKEKHLNDRIINLMKDNDSNEIKDVVSEKLSLKNNK